MASPGEIAPFFEGVSVCPDGPTTEPGASEGVRLREVSGGTLTGANLFKADLTKANLIQADLTEAFVGRSQAPGQLPDGFPKGWVTPPPGWELFDDEGNARLRRSSQRSDSAPPATPPSSPP